MSNPRSKVITVTLQQSFVHQNNGGKSPISCLLSVGGVTPKHRSIAATTNRFFCSQSIMLGDVYVINKYLSAIQSKFVGIVGHGLWVSDMDEVLKHCILDLSEDIKPRLHHHEAQMHGIRHIQTEIVHATGCWTRFQSTAVMMNGNIHILLYLYFVK